MLTNGQLNYLRSQGVAVRLINKSDGTSYVKGGDEQYNAYFSDPNLLDNFKTYLKDEVGERVDERLAKVYERLTNPKYIHKHNEALMFKLSVYLGDPDDYPFIKQEALERGLTMAQVADAIIAVANAYNANAAMVERRRVEFNLAVDSATTIDQLNTLWYAAEQAVGGL